MAVPDETFTDNPRDGMKTAYAAIITVIVVLIVSIIGVFWMIRPANTEEASAPYLSRASSTGTVDCSSTPISMTVDPSEA